MLAHAIATMRFAVRSPLPWIAAALAALAGWFGASFSVLAFGSSAGREDLLASTAQLGGAVVVIWLVARTLDDDADSGFTAASDATRWGPAGRHWGRWLGAVVAALATALCALLVSGIAAGFDASHLWYLLYTSIVPLGSLAAWGVALAARWRGGGAALAALGIWLLGHLPWGHEPFLEGAPARLLRGLLPQAAGAAALSGLLTTVGLLALAGLLAPHAGSSRE